MISQTEPLCSESDLLCSIMLILFYLLTIMLGIMLAYVICQGLRNMVVATIEMQDTNKDGSLRHSTGFTRGCKFHKISSWPSH